MMADWRAPLMSAVCYQDPKAALRWLEQAFGFEVSMLIEDGQGGLAHSEMRFGNAVVMVGNEWTADHKSPKSIGGKNTQTVHVQLPDGLDEHCERARAAGATIAAEPADQFYGDRSYRAIDPEGHRWTFAARVRDVSLAEAEAALGQPISATNWA